MPSGSPLVSIGLPVRNGAERVATAITSVLAQDHADLELVICDNASTDGTEDVCREFARADGRVAYHRHPENIGLFNNFGAAINLGRGELFRWIGDDDTLDRECISKCVRAFDADPGLTFVTTQISFDGPTGQGRTLTYEGTALGSTDPVDRLVEMLRLLNADFMLLSPLTAVARRKSLAAIPRRNMMREDQILAAQMALAGRWGHLREVLAFRNWKDESRSELTGKLGLPAWQARFASALELRELLRVVRRANLDPSQRRRAVAAVASWYVGWHSRRLRQGAASTLRWRTVRLAGDGRRYAGW